MITNKLRTFKVVHKDFHVTIGCCKFFGTDCGRLFSFVLFAIFTHQRNDSLNHLFGIIYFTTVSMNQGTSNHMWRRFACGTVYFAHITLAFVYFPRFSQIVIKPLVRHNIQIVMLLQMLFVHF